MTPRIGSLPWRRLAPVGVAAALLIPAAPGASAAGPDRPGGQWTAPFEEGGAGVPRCAPAQDGSGFIVCKPTAQAAALLPDGRVFYYNGLESWENAQHSTFTSAAPSSRNSQSRILDLRSGTPQFTIPAPSGGGQANPNIREGQGSPDNATGVAGIPGRPGDGLVGSTWGSLAGPAHDPTAPPDDTAANDADMFCADLMALPDGRILIAGGTDWYNEPALLDRGDGDPVDAGVGELEGLRSSRILDPAADTFSGTGSMKYGRWYPTLVELADGKVLVASGVTKLIKDTQGSQVRRTEIFDPATNTWTENYTGPASENTLPLVARLVLTPNGKVFYPGVGQMWGPFGQSLDEALFGLQQFFDPATKQWEAVGLAPVGARSGASVVPLLMTAPYDTMNLLTFGGTLGPPPGGYLALPLSTLTTIGADDRVSNELTGNLNHPRWYPSGVLLPDGTVLGVGGADKDEVIDPGTEIAVKTPELYDPATGQWTEVAAHTRDRTYHNSALLLPDMRVLLGGHSPLASHYAGPNRDQGRPFANNDKDSSFEVWSPPYLFRGERPRITAAPAGLAYGDRITLRTPDAADIVSVVLLRTPSPQHIMDPDQRGLSLTFTRSAADTLEVLAPPDGIAAPPGNYYLVINKAHPDGPVPSVARIVNVSTGSNPAEALQPFPDDAAAPGGSATPDQDTSTSGGALRSLAVLPAVALVAASGAGPQRRKPKGDRR
jgi:hypothetical protein